MRILHIDHDHSVRHSVELMLRSEGWTVYSSDRGEDGFDVARRYDFDLIVTEALLPDHAGASLVRRIRAAGVKTPILVLTGLVDVADTVRLFTAGADDVLPKPFHRDEFVARLLAIARRSRGHAAASISVGPLTVGLDSKSARIGDRPVHLTTKEFAILELLALRRKSVLTKDAILDHLYGGRDEPELKIIDVFVCKLRKKLAALGGDGLIQTVWGRGYMLSDAPEPEVALDVRPRIAAPCAAAHALN